MGRHSKRPDFRLAWYIDMAVCYVQVLRKKQIKLFGARNEN
jgi:hypothetical protein